MQYQEFIDQVENRTDLDTTNETARFVEVTLAALGERLYRTQREHLASQLPDELKMFLQSRAEPETTRQQVEGFTLQEFYNRVSQRTDTAYQTTIDRSQAVIQVLAEAVSEPVIQEIKSALPGEFGKLFTRSA